LGGDPPPNVLEDVCANEVGLVGRKTVRLPVLAGKREPGLRGFDVDGAARTAGERRDREGPRVSEKVEDRPAAGTRSKTGAVVPLIQVEAGLLAGGDVGEKSETVLEEWYGLGFRSGSNGRLSQVNCGGCRAVGPVPAISLGAALAHHETSRRKDFARGALDIVPPANGAFRRQIHDRHLAEDVQQDTRAVISLRVHGAKAGRLRRNDRSSERTRSLETLAKERHVGHAAVEAPEARHDLRAGREGAPGESPARGVGDLGEAVRAVPALRRDGPREDPRVPPQDGRLTARLQDETDQAEARFDDIGAQKYMEKRVPHPIDRAFNRLYGTDPLTRGEVYVFKGWVDRHALPYRYVVALGLSLLLVGLLMILMGSKS